MLSYTELYETLRKEKYSESLQLLPKKFILDFKEYLEEKSEAPAEEQTLFSESTIKSKKQLENAVGIFKEIILKRKRKILALAFIATETGIMKRDYENMLPQEREAFEKIVKSLEEEDKEISKILKGEKEKEENKMIIFKQKVEQFIDHKGNSVGPFMPKQLTALNSEIANILVSEGKAVFVEEN
ncbi:hypothetical protein HY450_04120 [Candidatus Pacearchaeota archaeon]|nr:hypothetical protein [Candidatus Pacearchaeota archaeon]